MAGFLSLLRLNNIPLCMYINIYIYLYRYHTFLIHSFIERHISSLNVMALANNAAMNTGVQMYLQDNYSFFFRYILTSTIAGPLVSSVFNFLRKIHLFFTVVVPIYILPTMHNCSPFSISSSIYLLSS